MTLTFYNVLHISGIILFFMAIGGAVIRAALEVKDKKLEKFILINHGIAGFIIIVSGFGQLAKIGMQFPGWVIIKIFIWLLLGAIIVPIKKAPDKKHLFWFIALLLGGLAAYMGIYKPF